MGTGAGALPAVRSSSVRAFADVFYHTLVTKREPLGAASLQARQAIAEDDGDPTWLAHRLRKSVSNHLSGQVAYRPRQSVLAWSSSPTAWPGPEVLWADSRDTPNWTICVRPTATDN
jgi:hypothetical protein